jgi:hypothetical protein
MSRHPHQRFPEPRRDGKIILGLILVAVGGLSLLHKLDIIPSLSYTLHYGWPFILIIIGVLIGIRNKFQRNAWWILCLIGTVNLIPIFHIGDTSSRELVWPAGLIILGLLLAFRQKKNGTWDRSQTEMVTNGESTLNIDVTMGGRKEIVTSKEFRGGKISTTFGGTEVNLMQADGIIQPMVLNISVSFGSVELIVPSHWEVINEIRPSMGSVEDHRQFRTPDTGVEKRTLYLRGSCSFGSVELKSY